MSAGRRENAASAASAQRLTGARREVLAVLEACGPEDAQGIAECWRSREAPGSALGDKLADMVTRLLFRLESLGWVEAVEEGFAITDKGTAVLHGDPVPVAATTE